jgi:hypothetical protein
MPRFTEEDKRLLYIVRSTAQELGTGTWADCEAIYNRLATCPRTEDGLKYKYKVMKVTTMKKRTNNAKWNAKRSEVKILLLEQVCNASQTGLSKSIS